MKKRKVRKAEYDAYLASPAWAAVRKAFYSKNARRCSRCDSTARLQLHHTTYRHVFNEQNYLEDLVCLCYSCHAAEHEAPVVSGKHRKGRKGKAFRLSKIPRVRTSEADAAKALARWAKQDAKPKASSRRSTRCTSKHNQDQP